MYPLPMNAVPSKTLIVEVALELGIDPAFVEKDWYVVQVIREIVNTDLFGAQLIFTGGLPYLKLITSSSAFLRTLIFG
jgi:predicted nucleotidyltransferase component of viral defense system